MQNALVLDKLVTRMLAHPQTTQSQRNHTKGNITYKERAQQATQEKGSIPERATIPSHPETCQRVILHLTRSATAAMPTSEACRSLCPDKSKCRSFVLPHCSRSVTMGALSKKWFWCRPKYVSSGSSATAAARCFTCDECITKDGTWSRCRC